ncbi:hypothetical protein [Reyranella sp. CPCC 100927]|uniref:hypothetical protein n=1 Tax=Reyranella sp. CPCC 100927 TaxID=2599616 RepID=UPI0011B4E649|nr:hypothetical protein [Reyranella sp. CPCC 100927]TWT13084.1 hypothetical protein FQU96_12670 [Reyranella sp. CPCC 100927]
MVSIVRCGMMGAVAVLMMIACAMAVAQTPKPKADEAPPSIGVAQMRTDGTIVLYLRATAPGGAVGHGLLEYPPGHPQYQDIQRHLGGIKPGEMKNVPPWPQ